MKYCVVSLLLVVIAGEATPGIQVAGFDDLLQLATGSSASHGYGMQERSDRSLANTFPFNASPDKNSKKVSLVVKEIQIDHAKIEGINLLELL